MVTLLIVLLPIGLLWRGVNALWFELGCCYYDWCETVTTYLTEG